MHKRYRTLMDFPSAKAIVPATIAMIPIFSILLLYVSGVLDINSYLKYISLSTAYIILTLLSLSIIPRLLKVKTILRLYRALSIALTNYIGFAFAFLICVQLEAISPALRTAFESLTLGTNAWSLFLALFAFSDDKSYQMIWKGMISPYTFLALDLLIYPEATVFKSDILMLVLSSFAIFLALVGTSLLAMNIGTTFTQYDTMAGMRGFFFAWFERDYEILEKSFEQNAPIKRLPIGIIRIKRADERELSIITPYVHPGPFLELSSANMPYILKEGFRRLEIEEVTLHGTCSHGENLTSQKEVQFVLDRIIDEYYRINPLMGCSKVKRVRYGDFTFTAQKFGNYVLLIVTRSPKDFDDISVSIGKTIYYWIRIEGYQGLLVDAHNCLSEPTAVSTTTEGSELAELLLKGAEKAIREIIDERLSENAKIGWFTVFPHDITIDEGLGPAGITSILISNEDQTFAYIVLDANNLGAGLRDAIIERIKADGLADDAEVLTTDTHVVNAHSPGSGYPLLRMEHFEKLYKHIKKTLIEARRNMKPFKADGKVIEMSLKVMGEDRIVKLMAVSLALTKMFPIMIVFTIMLSFFMPSLFPHALIIS